MADPRLTVVKMLMKMDSSEAYSNLLLDHVFSETDLSERDKAFAAAHPEFLPIVQPVPYAGAAGDPTRTYCPDENGGDGFFTASFRRVK